MAGAAPAGILAGRHVALSLVLSPLFLAAGLLCLVVAPSFALLVLGRALMGIGHTLLMVGGITALLQNDGGAGGSFRLNLFQFSGMLGILGGLALMGFLPAHWPWNLSLPVAAAPLLIGPVLGRALLRRFPPTPHAHGADLVVGEPVPDPAARHPRVRPRTGRRVHSPGARPDRGSHRAAAGGPARGSRGARPGAGRGDGRPCPGRSRHRARRLSALRRGLRLLRDGPCGLDAAARLN